jgi:hypothetical protein
MQQKSSKDLIRAWLKKRQIHPSAPPEIDDVRRDVGWSAIEKHSKRDAKSEKKSEH